MSVKLCLLVVALVVAGSASVSVGSKDPVVKQCKDSCKAQKQVAADEKEIKICIQQCKDESKQRGGVELEVRRGGPEERLEECSRSCQQQQQHCQSECLQEYQKEKEREGRGRREGEGSGNPEYVVCRQVCTKEGTDEDWKCERKCDKVQPLNEEEEEEEEETQEAEARNPYVFEDRHFVTGLQTQHGRLRILQRFSKRSKLLRGIKNYRVAILEAQPQTFILPSHFDAESLVFVANGRGTVSTIQQERRESFNIKQGDVFRVKSGTTTYLINKDNNERLVLVKLLQPVNTPGKFESFFGAGGENPESFYRAFSNEILEAAFNARSDKLERVFGQQKQGAIIKASQEQIRAMSHGEGGIFPLPFPFRGEESKETHNLYEQRPTQRNQYGQLYYADFNQFRQLRDLDVAVSLANISQGAMTAPHYNSRATKIGIVVNGEGYFEMACPHLSKSQQQRRGRGDEYSQEGQTRGYQKIRSNLKVGTVVVVPAGHPFVAVASNNQNLQLLCFEINAYNNEKYTLAGKGNVIRQLERQAKELAFGVPAREVDEVFNRQQEEFFFRGPRQGRADA